MSEIKVNSIRHNSDTEIVQFKGGVGVGTNTTAIRDAGISTATGSLHYNLTTSKLEFYDGSEWKAIKTQLPPLTTSYLVIGGGGAGGGNFRGSFGDWSVSRASAMEDKQTCQWTAIYEFDFPSTNSGYRVRYTCENTGGLYLNRPRGSDGGYNTNTSRSSLLVLELGD